MEKVIEIGYTPRGWAQEFHDSPSRYKILVLHRRAGKTTACINHLIRDACLTPNSRYAYIAPFYKQAKTVAWDMLKEYSRKIPAVKINESELKVDYPNGSRIQLFGADNPDALRGIALWGVIFDEYSQQPKSIFTEVISPALVDHNGYAIWIGTPKGMNDFYRLYEEHKADENWYCKVLKASDSGILSQEALANERRNMSADEFNQEYECSFTAALKGAYYCNELLRSREQGRVTRVPVQKEFRVNTYWDLGISDTTCIIFAQTIGKEVHIIDFYQNNGLGFDHYVKVLDEKAKEYGYNYASHYLPHDVKQRELSTGRSRFEILKNMMGVGTVKVVPDMSIKDGIEAARIIFDRCWFANDKTLDLLDALGSYTQEWDDKKGMFKDRPLHNWASHAADCFRMMAVGIKDDNLLQFSSPVKSKYNERFDKHSDIMRKPSLSRIFKKFGAWKA